MRISSRAIIFKDNQVILIYRKRDNQEYYVFPGGKVEPGETLEEALIREWKEECGIIIENIQFLEESIDHQDGNTIHLTCFVCSSKKIPDKPKVHSQFIWTTPEHIYDHNFFESDKILVEKLKEKWPCLIEQMK